MLNSFLTSLYVRFSTLRDEDGQTAVEYALVLALVALALVGALALGLNGVLQSTIDKITAKLT